MLVEDVESLYCAHCGRRGEERYECRSSRASGSGVAVDVRAPSIHDERCRGPRVNAPQTFAPQLDLHPWILFDGVKDITARQ